MPSVAPFAILRTEKIKDWSTLTKSIGHCLRTSTDDRTHLAADVAEPLRILLGEANWVADWKKCVDGMWLPKLKMGTTHTIAREFILTTSPEFFANRIISFIKSKEKLLFLKRSHIEQTEAFYEKHGGQAVIMARFVPIVRTVAPFVAGAGSMTYTKYITFCIIGAVLWVTGITTLGYFLGTNDWVKHNFEKVVLGIVAVSVLPMIIGVLKAKFSNNAVRRPN